MRIGIDCRTAVGARAGLGRYVETLVDTLVSDEQTPHQYNLYFCRSDIRLEQRWRGKAEHYHLKAPLTNLWTHVSLPVHLLRKPIDVCHLPNFIVPFYAPCKTVVTFHDLNFLRFRKHFTLRTYLALAWQVRLSARRASAIIVVSNSTKADVLRILKPPEEKVHLIYNGISPLFRPIDSKQAQDALRAKYGMHDYILCVGSLAPQKNLRRLIRAFVKLKQETQLPVKLVIVGGQAWKFEPIFDEVRSLNVEHEIVFTGYVSEEELLYLYNGAKLFVYPSIYEGFGLPVVEAMACGVPTITSNVSSLPEVAGSAAKLVDPYDEAALAEAMATVLEDETLRTQMAAQGLAQAAKFSLEQMARQTRHLYESVGNS